MPGPGLGDRLRAALANATQRPDATLVSDTPRPDPSGLPAALPLGMLAGMASDAVQHPMRTALGFVPGVAEGMAAHDAYTLGTTGHPLAAAATLAMGTLPAVVRDAAPAAGSALRAALASAAERDAATVGSRLARGAVERANDADASALAERLARTLLQRADNADTQALGARLRRPQ